MFRVIAVTIGVLLSVAVVQASAATKSVRHPTITMKAGNRAGLQNVFAWDAKCRTVRVRVAAHKPKKGKVYLVKSKFAVPASLSQKCAGRKVRGYKVVFKADKNAKGTTLVTYQVSSGNVKNTTFKFRRTLKIK
ncbi:hypothetical protein OEG84_16965 [Hoeflea sp. G2-23]|jgi:hypothetical protein|uniref:Uncharacterized protein n=1 Tax=Hoeflea algicola TaxID=2983763 RepID=A0ABT3ZC91_9HYPH|nr:hypothetical protein [Hoeflea algicola]MCY0149354.1 hypothetical protein [Hoeflea algicola]